VLHSPKRRATSAASWMDRPAASRSPRANALRAVVAYRRPNTCGAIGASTAPLRQIAIGGRSIAAIDRQLRQPLQGKCLTSGRAHRTLELEAVSQALGCLIPATLLQQRFAQEQPGESLRSLGAGASGICAPLETLGSGL
jgi:hypothetical protein